MHPTLAALFLEGECRATEMAVQLLGKGFRIRDKRAADPGAPTWIAGRHSAQKKKREQLIRIYEVFIASCDIIFLMTSL